MRQKNGLYVILIIAAAVMWGCIGVFIRHLSAFGLTSRQITVIRCIVNAGLMFVLILVTDRSRFRISLRDIGWFLLNGVGSIFLFYTAYQSAITMTSMPTAVALLYTAPAFVLIMSVLFFHEKMTSVKAAAVILSIVGSALVSGIIGGLVFHPAGIALGLLSGFGYALYSIFSTVILKKYHAFTNVFYSFSFAAIAGLLTCDIGSMAKTFSREPKAIAWGLACGIVTGFLSYLIYTIGLTRVPASRAAVYASIEPVVATLLGVLVYKEKLSAFGAIGIGCILFAIVLMNLFEEIKTKRAAGGQNHDKRRKNKSA